MADWLIDEDELDDDQRSILNLPPSVSRVVYGAAGSGKTLLALWRTKAIQRRSNDSSFSFIVYTKALRRFIDSGIIELKLDGAKVMHYDKWNKETRDYIIVDEAQDFSESEILAMKNASRNSVILFGDTAQQLYDKKSWSLPSPENTLSINEIVTLTGYQSKELPQNYRIPLGVAKFAQHLNSKNNDIISRCKSKDTTSKPIIRRFNTWEQELDFIINEISIKGLKDVAILLPFNKTNRTGISPSHYSVENVHEYFDKKGIEHLYKIDGTVELDFGSTLPKITTYNSSKGLQFETVFIPHCGINWDKFKNALYVALTRTSKDLIITYSDSLTYWFNSIPNSLYNNK
jgi:superfamily I DNA/RNA helicase